MLRSPSPRYVILVENEALLRLLFAEALADAGLRVAQASTMAEVLAAMDEEPLGLAALITDIDLGEGETGWAVARRVRESHPTLPVLYMSGASAQHWPSQGVAGSRMLPKPFGLEQFVEALAALIGPEHAAPTQGLSTCSTPAAITTDLTAQAPLEAVATPSDTPI